ncbi:MAG: hypothetical protein ACLS36_05455 [Streptococcus sp.]
MEVAEMTDVSVETPEIMEVVTYPRMLRKLQLLMLMVQLVRNLKWLTCLVNQAK